MKSIAVVVCTVFLMGAWAPYAAGAEQRDNAVGVGFGVTTGVGLLYQRRVADRWRIRLNGGMFPDRASSAVFAGGGVLRDLGDIAGGKSYAFGLGQYYTMPDAAADFSFVPGFGVQWGPFLAEAGASFVRSDSRRGDGSWSLSSWGVYLALGLGLIWEF